MFGCAAFAHRFLVNACTANMMLGQVYSLRCSTRVAVCSSAALCTAGAAHNQHVCSNLAMCAAGAARSSAATLFTRKVARVRNVTSSVAAQAPTIKPKWDTETAKVSCRRCAFVVGLLGKP